MYSKIACNDRNIIINYISLTFARKLSVVFSAALVTAHDTLDVLSIFVTLSAERDQRTTGLRACRARRGTLLRLVQMVATSTTGWVAPRWRY